MPTAALLVLGWSGTSKRHYDYDYDYDWDHKFDLIADVDSRLAHRWIVPRGTAE